jgi:purine-nucleoside phosphorylase
MESPMDQLWEKVQETKAWLECRVAARPKVGLILGSGLSVTLQALEISHLIPYGEIPHFPKSTAPGHEGALAFGELDKLPVAVLRGRFHFYEGYRTWEITFPIRVLGEVGVKILIVTNAAGGLNPSFEAGEIMAIVDHINLIPENPLRGLDDPRLGDRFPDMSRAYDPELISIAERIALAEGIPLRKGVYVGIPGPSLETPAETRFLRMIGADAVGMSTTPEVIVSRSIGMRVLGISVISNVNRPDCMEPILVEEILECSRRTAPKLSRLLEGIMREMKALVEME